MDENMSDDERSHSPIQTDNAKRLKTENDCLDTEDLSRSSNNTEQEGASTSTDSGVGKSGKNSTGRGKEQPSSKVEGPKQEQNAERSENENENSFLREDQSNDSYAFPVFSDEGSAFQAFSPSSVSNHTLNFDSDTEEDIPLVLKKEKPKQNWFIIPEIANRQTGYSCKYQSPEQFMRRCYGSLRNVQRLELMYKLEEHEGCVNSLNFHPDGSLLASGSDDLKVVLWDWKVGKSLLKIQTRHKRNVFQSKFLNLSGDLHIVTCARDGQVCYSQVSREEGLRDSRKLGSHRGPCHKLALLNEQPHLVLSVGEDGLVLSHDVRKNKPERLVNVKENDREVALYSIHSHPLRTHEFCVCGRDEMVRIYDQRKSNSPISVFYPFPKSSTGPSRGYSYHVTCAVYNHDGSEILASYNDADIYLFDVNAPPGQYIHSYMGHRNGATIKGVNFFGPKSEFIVSGSDCGHVYFWDRNNESIVNFMLADDNGVVNCLEPHPQLPFICTSGLDWDIKVWVPSCEKDPEMKNLSEFVRKNKDAQNWSTEMNEEGLEESQVLWRLWRRLRTSNRRVMRDHEVSLHIERLISSSSSSSNSWQSSNDDDSDDDTDGDDAPGCSTS